MSNVMVVPPILGALVKSEDMLGQNRVWQAVNARQSRLIEEYFSQRAELTHFSEKELRAWASLVAADLNMILAQEGFSIQLQDFNDREFGVVSILDVLVEWMAQGVAGKIFCGEKSYPAVMLKPTVAVENGTVKTFTVYASSLHDYPLVQLGTKSGDLLYMTIADSACSDFDLISRINMIRRGIKGGRGASYLMFPMTDLNVETNLGWLIGMHTRDSDGEWAAISQALQQTKFKMNEFGARVKSAVAIAIARTSVHMDITPPVIIDKPFFLWIERPGMSFPLMYAYIDEQDWKNPGDLSNI